MASHTGTKINQLLKIWPAGTVATLSWLETQGAYQQLVHEYKRNSWVSPVGRGAYVRAGDKVDWTGGLFAIQEQLKLPIHAGGKTALQMQGYAHFLPMGKGSKISLFGPPGVKLPSWFKQFRWNVRVQYTSTKLFPVEAEEGLTQHEKGHYQVKISTPERAMMEVLHDVPKEESYEEARLLMEGLTTLRPKVTQTLLEHCASVKVKRLFLLLAESCQHPWVKKLDPTRVNLGRGKRMLIKGGRFDSKYNITVPHSQA